ncbi:hypothetical protein DH2020_028523 [Rehmannia glutinosa]|uniref:Uncharacterized protein n=1 Tax=Rehmannia glutinosa TaxID=99300 RepID=A0ABR0VS42_REHGL
MPRFPFFPILTRPLQPPPYHHPINPATVAACAAKAGRRTPSAPTAASASGRGGNGSPRSASRTAALGFGSAPSTPRSAARRRTTTPRAASLWRCAKLNLQNPEDGGGGFRVPSAPEAAFSSSVTDYYVERFESSEKSVLDEANCMWDISAAPTLLDEKENMSWPEYPPENLSQCNLMDVTSNWDDLQVPWSF